MMQHPQLQSGANVHRMSSFARWLLSTTKRPNEDSNGAPKTAELHDGHRLMRALFIAALGLGLGAAVAMAQISLPGPEFLAHRTILSPQASHVADLMTAAEMAVYGDALQYLRDQHPSSAFGRFCQLADAGHAPSAQMALAMLSNGEALYGMQWTASLAQQQRWASLVSAFYAGNATTTLSMNGD
jgi:hypothetical protein